MIIATDDNLKADGGYCSRCDTVWASPGKCRCKMIYETELKNPIKLDITHAKDGTCIQWNGEKWLAYDSEEAAKFRDDCLHEFKNTNNHLRLLKTHIWNAAIEAAAKLMDEMGEEARKAEEMSLSNTAYLMMLNLIERRINHSSLTITGRRPYCRR